MKLANKDNCLLIMRVFYTEIRLTQYSCATDKEEENIHDKKKI